MKWILLTLLCVQSESLMEIARTRTSFLEKYEGYVNSIIAHFLIPRDTLFASFHFRADEMKMSIFSCSPRKVSLYMKHRSPPVINPDGSKFPPDFKNITRSKLYNIEFESDRKGQYLNLTAPDPGLYFVAVFLSYTNPKHAAIKQQGLGAQCFAFVDASVYITHPDMEQVLDDIPTDVVLTSETSSFFKFFIPYNVDHATLKIDNVSSSNLTVRVEKNKIPSNISVVQVSTTLPISIPFDTPEVTWYYIEFISDNNATLTFSLKYFSDELPEDNSYEIYANSTLKIYRGGTVETTVPYREYELIRQSRTDSFIFTFALEKELAVSEPLAVNVTSDEFTSLKFGMRDITDLGGTVHVILAFKPRLNKDKTKLEKEPAAHRLIGCIRNGEMAIPKWPDLCVEGAEETVAPIILNTTIDNATVLIPFPESGMWFATFKLYCGICEPCKCPTKCEQEFVSCTRDCETACNSDEDCVNCAKGCRNDIVGKNDCKKCDCDGPCIKNTDVCKSGIIFDVSSNACVEGSCGKNGKCMFMVSDGIVYSTCVCQNNYRGWDCSDDSQANPYWMIVLELLLLVLSNLMFLPAVYFAFRRRYYVEAIVYMSICFFSTFYHACDAGEKIISFCITSLGALQFADFFCAVLSVWVTLIAMADLPAFWPSLCQMTGAIILAFVVSINKTSMWVFVVPSIVGAVILIVSWYFKWRKIRQMFLNKRYLYLYLPIGFVVVTVGLVIFAMLETTDNYKYLHSLWHVIMACAVIIVLPRENTFQPETML